MDFQTIKSTLVGSEKQLIELRNQANSEDGNASTRFDLRNLIESRVNAFIELLNSFSTEQYLEVCDAMRRARA
jgi:hypothetical protein